MEKLRKKQKRKLQTYLHVYKNRYVLEGLWIFKNMIFFGGGKIVDVKYLF